MRESKRGAKVWGRMRGSDGDDGLLLFAAVTLRQRVPTDPLGLGILGGSAAEKDFIQNSTRARRSS